MHPLIALLRQVQSSPKTKTSCEVSLLHEILRLDAQTGILYWRSRPEYRFYDEMFNRQFAGKPSGSFNAVGYIQISFTHDHVKYKMLAHRVVYAMHHGRWAEFVDHVNCIKADNRPCNLREVTFQGNVQNRHFVKSDSGFKGVCHRRRQGRFHAQICVDNKNVHLGAFGSAEEAAKAYDSAAVKFFGEFAKTNAQMGLL